MRFKKGDKVGDLTITKIIEDDSLVIVEDINGESGWCWVGDLQDFLLKSGELIPTSEIEDTGHVRRHPVSYFRF